MQQLGAWRGVYGDCWAARIVAPRSTVASVANRRIIRVIISSERRDQEVGRAPARTRQAARGWTDGRRRESRTTSTRNGVVHRVGFGHRVISSRFAGHHERRAGDWPQAGRRVRPSIRAPMAAAIRLGRADSIMGGRRPPASRRVASASRFGSIASARPAPVFREPLAPSSRRPREACGEFACDFVSARIIR